ncbi:MAG: SDR family oxidoreductase [bacterium]|nr:SDR family oxidoreductase [bacterium]
MEIRDKTVIVTGATGGIGSCIALDLADRGANLALVGRNAARLKEMMLKCEDRGARCLTIVADISREEDIKRIVEETEKALGPVDILLNNAGATSFKPPTGYSADEVENIVMTNIYGPIRLTQAVLPGMVERKSGHIVNIGSIFGSLSFPYFGVYSASKCAIRGYTEALRREIYGSGVGITYVAPRGTLTSQTDEFLEMARKTGMNLDIPERVAEIVVDAIGRGRKDVYIGRPERLFVLINKLFPSIIDKALRKNVSIMSNYF